MNTIEIKGSLRTETGKKATKALRRAKNVPCVVYGKEKNIHFYAHENEFKKIVYTDRVYIINLNLDGDVHTVIMKELQFNPITDALRHIDFLEVSNDKAFSISVPVNYVGVPAGAIAGGNFNKRRRYLKIKGLLDNIPNTIDVEVSKLNIGDSLRIGSIESENYTILDKPELTLCSVNVSRLAMKNAAAAAAEDEEEATEEASEE